MQCIIYVSVKNRDFMLSVVKLSVVMLSVVVLCCGAIGFWCNAPLRELVSINYIFNV